MFGNVTALEGLHVKGKYRDKSPTHTYSRHAAWDPHSTWRVGLGWFSIEVVVVVKEKCWGDGGVPLPTLASRKSTIVYPAGEVASLLTSSFLGTSLGESGAEVEECGSNESRGLQCR